jgi:uncharacterized protein
MPGAAWKRRYQVIVFSHEIDESVALVAFVALLVAGLVKGVTGIGYATTAMPLLVIAFGLEKALALVVVPAIVSNAAIFIGAESIRTTLKRFQLFYLGILPGIAGGTALLGMVDTRLATNTLAAVTLAYVALAVIRPSLSLPPSLEQPLALPAGILNGVLTGLTGSQILPLVPYMMALRLEPQAQVIAINLAVTIASIVLGVTLLATGGMTGELLMLSCAGAFPAIGGALMGNAVRGLLPVEALRRLTLVMLVVIAVGLGGRSAFDATVGSLCGQPVAAQAVTDQHVGDQASDRGALQCLARLGGSLSPTRVSGEVLHTQ